MKTKPRIVQVRYLDIVLFTHTNPEKYRPNVREAVGYLQHEDKEFVRIVWEKGDPIPEGKPCQSGLVIPRNCIVELKEIE